MASVLKSSHESIRIPSSIAELKNAAKLTILFCCKTMQQQQKAS
jgi:hypothetical protein